MDSIAAEIAIEILVVFENRHGDTLASQEITQHHSRRTAPAIQHVV